MIAGMTHPSSARTLPSSSSIFLNSRPTRFVSTKAGAVGACRLCSNTSMRLSRASTALASAACCPTAGTAATARTSDATSTPNGAVGAAHGVQRVLRHQRCPFFKISDWVTHSRLSGRARLLDSSQARGCPAPCFQGLCPSGISAAGDRGVLQAPAVAKRFSTESLSVLMSANSHEDK